MLSLNNYLLNNLLNLKSLSSIFSIYCIIYFIIIRIKLSYNSILRKFIEYQIIYSDIPNIIILGIRDNAKYRYI